MMAARGMAPHVEITGSALAAKDVTSVRDGVLYFVTESGGGFTAGDTWQVGGTAAARTLTLRSTIVNTGAAETVSTTGGFSVVTTSVWGLTANSRPYYDANGATAGQEARLAVDGDNRASLVNA